MDNNTQMFLNIIMLPDFYEMYLTSQNLGCRNKEKSFPGINFSRDFFKLIWEINSVLFYCRSLPRLTALSFDLYI